MNQIAIAIQINQKRFVIGARWPTMAVLADQAKRKAQAIALSVAMAIIPLPGLPA